MDEGLIVHEMQRLDSFFLKQIVRHAQKHLLDQGLTLGPTAFMVLDLLQHWTQQATLGLLIVGLLALGLLIVGLLALGLLIVGLLALGLFSFGLFSFGLLDDGLLVDWRGCRNGRLGRFYRGRTRRLRYPCVAATGSRLLG